MGPIWPTTCFLLIKFYWNIALSICSYMVCIYRDVQGWLSWEAVTEMIYVEKSKIFTIFSGPYGKMFTESWPIKSNKSFFILQKYIVSLGCNVDPLDIFQDIIAKI